MFVLEFPSLIYTAAVHRFAKTFRAVLPCLALLFPLFLFRFLSDHVVVGRFAVTSRSDTVDGYIL